MDALSVYIGQVHTHHTDKGNATAPERINLN